MSFTTDPKEKLRKVVPGKALNLDQLNHLIEGGHSVEEALDEILSETGIGTPKLGRSRVPSERVEREKLGLLYMNDGMTATIIRKYIRAIMGSGYYFAGLGETELAQWTAWAKKVRFKRELKRSLRHAMVYGDGYIEIVQNVDGTEVVRLFNLDPETMDFNRNDMLQIELDEFRNPKEYLQTIVYGKYEEKPIAARHIFHLKLDEIGDCLDGIAPLEQLYKPIVIKLNIEEHLGEGSFRYANPLYVLYIGDNLHEPSVDEITAGVQELAQVDERSVFAWPYFYRMDKISGEAAESLVSYIDHFTDQICAGLDFPKILLLPSDISAEGAERQVTLWEEQIFEYQNDIEEQIEDDLLVKVAEVHGWQVPQFRLHGGRRMVNKIISQTIAQYVRTGVLQPDKPLEDYIRQHEGLPAIDPSTHPGFDHVRVGPTGRNIGAIPSTKGEPQEKKEKKTGPKASEEWNAIKDYLSLYPDVSSKEILEELSIENNKRHRSWVAQLRYKIKQEG